MSCPRHPGGCACKQGYEVKALMALGLSESYARYTLRYKYREGEAYKEIKIKRSKWNANSVCRSLAKEFMPKQYERILNTMRQYKVGRKTAIKIIAAQDSDGTQAEKEKIIIAALRRRELYKNTGNISRRQIADNQASINRMFELGKRAKSSLSYADCMGRKEIEIG